MHRLSRTVSLLTIFLFSLITLGNEAWGQPQKWEEFGSLGVVPTQEAIVSASTSLIIDDPLGDYTTANPIVDIDAVEGGTNGTDMTLKILFSSDTTVSSGSPPGSIYLDLDQNPATGSPQHGIGAEAVIFINNQFLFGGGKALWARSPGLGTLWESPLIISGQSLEFTMPLWTLLDDGNMDLVVSMASDIAPNEGHGTITIGCPVNTVASQSDQFSPFDLPTLYRFRDEILAQSVAGRRYISKYYKHAKEGTRLLLRHPELLLQTGQILMHILPAIESVVDETPASLSVADVEDIDTLLKTIASKGSPQLRWTVQQLRSDLRSGRLLPVMGMGVQAGR